MPKWSAKPSKLKDEMFLNILTLCYEVHQNHCASCNKRKVSGLQQHIKWPENNWKSWRNNEQWTLLFSAVWFHQPTWGRWNHLLLVSTRWHYCTHTSNNSMKLLNEIFGECVISINLWPLTRWFLLHQSSKICSVSWLPTHAKCFKNSSNCMHRKHLTGRFAESVLNKIKWVQTCINTCEHHFRHLL